MKQCETCLAENVMYIHLLPTEWTAFVMQVSALERKKKALADRESQVTAKRQQIEPVVFVEVHQLHARTCI